MITSTTWALCTLWNCFIVFIFQMLLLMAAVTTTALYHPVLIMCKSHKKRKKESCMSTFFKEEKKKRESSNSLTDNCWGLGFLCHQKPIERKRIIDNNLKIIKQGCKFQINNRNSTHRLKNEPAKFRVLTINSTNSNGPLTAYTAVDTTSIVKYTEKNSSAARISLILWSLICIY